MNDPGFLGTNATMLADLTLVAYVLLIAPGMLVGYVFARRKMFVPHHKLMMTTIVIVNWLLIIFVMAASFAARDGASRPIPHLITGGLAQLIGTYLVILMWTEKTSFAWILPNALRVSNIKLVMRTALVLWLVTVVLGVVIYLSSYTPTAISTDAPLPVATEEATDATAEAPTADATDESPAPAATEESPAADATDESPPPAATEES